MSLKAPKNRFKEGTKTLYWVRGKQWEDVDGNIYDIRQSKPTALNTVLAVSGQLLSVRAAAVKYADSKWKNRDEWLTEYNQSIADFEAGAQWLISQAACATAKGEERKE